MSFEKISKLLTGDTPGRTTELNYFRIGPADADKKVYLQAALHADEQHAPRGREYARKCFLTNRFPR